jgi:tyrosinase
MTSDDVRDTKAFGYSYPELPDWDMTPSELAASVRSHVNSLYNPTINSNGSAVSVKIRRRFTNLADSFGHVTLDLARHLGVNNLDRQWSITVMVDRFPIDTNFAIDFFMGDAPESATDWPAAKNLIGTFAQFGPANVSTMHPEGNPKGQIQGEVSLTHTLAAGVSRGIILSLAPQHVVPVLRRALHWKARTPAGRQIPLDALTGLTVAVSSKSVMPPKATDQFPRYGIPQWQVAATEGKPCGARRSLV